MDFAQVESSAEEDRTLQATLIPAGAVNLPLNEDTDANQCSYGFAYRNVYRGGPYMGITADYPQPSIYVRAQILLCMYAALCRHQRWAALWKGLQRKREEHTCTLEEDLRSL